MNWYNIIPEEARAPLMKKGKVAIEFAILKDGKIAGMKIVGPSGDVSLDRAAWGGITASVSVRALAYRVPRTLSGVALPLLLQPCQGRNRIKPATSEPRRIQLRCHPERRWRFAAVVEGPLYHRLPLPTA